MINIDSKYMEHRGEIKLGLSLLPLSHFTPGIQPLLPDDGINSYNRISGNIQMPEDYIGISIITIT